MDINYSEAMVEVLDILEHTDKADVEKIPTQFIEFLKKNQSKNYKSNLNHSQNIKDMNLNPKTQALLGLIYMKFWASEKEKKDFFNKINNNEKIFREEMNKKYNYNHL